MDDFKFPEDSLRLEDVRRGDGTLLFDGQVQPDGAAFEKLHIHPVEDMAGEGHAFVMRISAPDIDPAVRFDGADFKLNGSASPVSDADSRRIGIARHHRDHSAYTGVVVRYREEVELRGQIIEDAQFARLVSGGVSQGAAKEAAARLAGNFMAKEWRGVCNVLRMARQKGGIAGYGRPHRPALLLGDDDGFLTGSGFSDAASFNAVFLEQMPLHKLAGDLG